MQVYGLMASDERVEFREKPGSPITWQELKERAAKEAN